MADIFGGMFGDMFSAPEPEEISSASAQIWVPCPICHSQKPAQVTITQHEGYIFTGQIAYSVEFWAHINNHKKDAETEGDDRG